MRMQLHVAFATGKLIAVQFFTNVVEQLFYFIALFW